MDSGLVNIFGVSAGFTTLLIAAGFGLANLFATFPGLYEILKIISFVFLVYLAWKIGSAGRAQTKRRDQPLSFSQGAMFQLINPKVISVIISSVTAYTSSATAAASEFFVLFGIFSVVTIASTCTWTLFGMVIRQILITQERLRSFNIIMAGLLLTSLLPVLIT